MRKKIEEDNNRLIVVWFFCAFKLNNFLYVFVDRTKEMFGRRGKKKQRQRKRETERDRKGEMKQKNDPVT